MKMETQYTILMEGSKSSSKSTICNNTHAHIKKGERSQVYNLTLYLKKLQKEHQTKPKVRRRKEIMKIKAEINEGNTRKTIGKCKQN